MTEPSQLIARKDHEHDIEMKYNVNLTNRRGTRKYNTNPAFAAEDDQTGQGEQFRIMREDVFHADTATTEAEKRLAAKGQGLRDWMAGRSSSAYQRLLAAAQWGATMGEPYDQGLAELWLGRLSAGGFLGPAANAHSEEHLQRARELFTQPKLGVNFSYPPLRK